MVTVPSEIDPPDSGHVVARGQVVQWYARSVAWVGPLVLGGVLVVDRGWAAHWLAMVAMLGFTVLLRTAHIALGKFAYLPPSGIVALSGTVLAARVRRLSRCGSAPSLETGDSCANRRPERRSMRGGKFWRRWPPMEPW